MDPSTLLWGILGIAATVYCTYLALSPPEWLKKALHLPHGITRSNSSEVLPPPPLPNQPWNIPLSPNTHFTGRVEILAELRKSLLSRQFAALTALHGLGGVGKTQTALQYVYLHRKDYRVIWWIRSEEPAQLALDYTSLAVKLDPSYESVKDQRELIPFVRNWLETHDGWLLVFDNVRQPEDLAGYRPTGGSGHVIVTSRHEDWSAYPASVEIPTFDRQKESIVFLLERMGIKDKADDKDKAAAAEIARELEDLPLALEHAAAYCCAVGCTLSHYLDLYRERRLRLLDEVPQPHGYPGTVLTTWNMAFTEAEKTPGAADLLRLAAFLAPDNIPLDLITGGIKHLPKALAAVAKNQVALDKAIAALKRLSLVQTADATFSIHRLVQLVLLDRMNKKAQKLWATAAVKVVSAAYPFDSDDVSTWDACKRLLPHATAAAEHAESLEVAPEAAGHIWNQCGLYVQGLANYVSAQEYYKRALCLHGKVFGTDHPEVAAIVNNLGLVLRALGDLPGARARFERALRIDERIYGPDHPEVATDVNNLGGVLWDLGDLPGARAHFERALRIGEATLGPDHHTVAIRVNNLGLVLRAMGDLPGARARFERALKIFEGILGENHPNVATLVNNLGSVLQDLGDLPGARAHYERALRIFRQYFDDSHPHVQTVLGNLQSLNSSPPPPER
ncbi:MAG: tetratricopeptide repeat protein [Candidatus Zixiibacteriota bacterium]|nr:MAG: tetratricopeptide repeat protein [candidate division Zixibacteria bacterium]